MSQLKLLAACAHAMTKARFKNVLTSETARTVKGEKRTVGQWTKGKITATVTPAQTGSGSTVTVRSEATAQSLLSLIWKPSDRLARRFLSRLRSA